MGDPLVPAPAPTPLEISAELPAAVWSRLEALAKQRQCTPAELIAEAVAYYFSPDGAGRNAVAISPEPASDLWASAPKRPK